MKPVSLLVLWKEASIGVRIMEKSELERAQLSRRESVCSVVMGSCLIDSLGGEDSTSAEVVFVP